MNDTHIIRKHPGNKTGISKCIVIDKNHLIMYLKEMEIGEEVEIKSDKILCGIKKLSD